MSKFIWTTEKAEMAKAMIDSAKSNKDIFAAIGYKVRTIQRFKSMIELGGSLSDIIKRRGRKPNQAQRCLASILNPVTLLTGHSSVSTSYLSTFTSLTETKPADNQPSPEGNKLDSKTYEKNPSRQKQPFYYHPAL